MNENKTITETEILWNLFRKFGYQAWYDPDDEDRQHYTFARNGKAIIVHSKGKGNDEKITGIIVHCKQK